MRKKLAAYFSASGGSGMGRIEVLKKLCPSANWKSGKVVNGMSEKALADWANSL